MPWSDCSCSDCVKSMYLVDIIRLPTPKTSEVRVEVYLKASD